MGEEEYRSVVDLMHLPNGLIFGLPVVLDTDSEDVVVGDKVLLTYKGEVGCPLLLLALSLRLLGSLPSPPPICSRRGSQPEPAAEGVQPGVSAGAVHGILCSVSNAPPGGRAGECVIEIVGPKKKRPTAAKEMGHF